MNVVLTPEAERFVNEKLQSGEYQTPSEVIEDARQLPRGSDDQDYREAVDGIGPIRNISNRSKRGSAWGRL